MTYNGWYAIKPTNQPTNHSKYCYLKLIIQFNISIIFAHS